MCHVPGSFYVVEAVAKTPDVPYGEKFHSTTRCLLLAEAAGRTRMTVRGSVTTSLWAITKNFVKKTTSEVVYTSTFSTLPST